MEVLTPLVAGLAHRHATIGGHRLHYVEAGEGEPLLLLHGWPQHWWSWRHVIGPLSERYRVICPDVRGLGWSEGPGPGAAIDDYSLHRLARDMLELADELGLGRLRVVGHDWGCVTAYRACLSHPERFAAGVFLGGVHPWSAFAHPWLYLRPWHLWGYAALGPGAMNALGAVTRCLREWRHVGAFTAEEEQVYVERTDTPAGRAATGAYDRNIIVREIPHFLRVHRSLRLRVPALHLNGAEDPLTRKVPGHWRHHADAMRLEQVPDCGHFIAEERPEELLDRIVPFLERP